MTRTAWLRTSLIVAIAMFVMANASVAWADTEQSSNAASGNNSVILLVVALGILLGILLMTRTKRKRP
jgi:uncharacterized membrane protein YidH (DUF202 family)